MQQQTKEAGQKMRLKESNEEENMGGRMRQKNGAQQKAWTDEDGGSQMN
jgi:hypothetical protein